MRSFVITGMLLWFVTGGCFAATPAEIKQQVKANIEQQQRLQQQTDKALNHIDQLRSELRQQKLLLRWTEHQNAQHRDYLDHQRKNLSQLQQKRVQARQLRIALEPELPMILQRLLQQVTADLPFYAEERRQRLNTLSQRFTDPSVPLSERTRRLFEALQIEAGFSRSIETSETSIELEGEKLFGHQLQVGRQTLFFVTRDGSRAARLLPGQSWQPLNVEETDTVQQALKQVLSQQITELQLLPLTEVSP